jgi:hypothetical protein
VIVGRGLIARIVACGFYDAFRLFAVYVMGWMGDFIPRMGTWITGDADPISGAVVGYVWRYLGDAGGLGVAFYLMAFAVGLDQRFAGRGRVVSAAVSFAVVVWTGLIATVAVAPRGQDLVVSPDTVGGRDHADRERNFRLCPGRGLPACATRAGAGTMALAATVRRVDLGLGAHRGRGPRSFGTSCTK